MSTDPKQVEELAAVIHQAIVGGDDPSTCDRTAGPCWAAARALAAHGWMSPEQHQAEIATSRREALDDSFRRITADRSAEIDRLGGIGEVRASTALNNWVEGIGVAARHVDDVRDGRPARSDHHPHETYASHKRDHVAEAAAIRKQVQG